MTQVPAWRKVTVDPATVQARWWWPASTEKVTGEPESPPVAVTAYVSPNDGEAGGLEVKVIDCAAFGTSTDCVAVGAASWSASPAWSAAMHAGAGVAEGDRRAVDGADTGGCRR